MLHKLFRVIGLAGIGLLLTYCMAPVSQRAMNRLNGWQTTTDTVYLTPAEQYAGEILSYMLPLVLGQEGRFERRADWRERSLDESLDFARIAAKMEEAGNGKADLLVLDSNILGLSAVLYHYCRELNQFKGKYIYDSLYPSSELVALRILLLQKIRRGPKAHLGALVENEMLLKDPRLIPSDDDLKAIGLTRTELQLLSDVLHSEPLFSAYLKHPFLVDSFYRAGAVTRDPYVTQKIAAANYDRYPACTAAPAPGTDPVIIALLPSMTKEFEYGGAVKTGATPYGFKPTATFEHITENLRHRIIENTVTLASRDQTYVQVLQAASGDLPLKSRLRGIITRHVRFCVQDRRPLVIYPGNADRVLPGVSGDADLNIILLGKDVYLALEIRPDQDVYPHTNCIYLDLMDVKHDQVDDAIDQISAFILAKLKDEATAFNGLQANQSGA